MNKILFAVALGMISLSTIAAPSKSDAEKWLSDFRVVKDQTSDAIVLGTGAKRKDTTAAVESLKRRADKLFTDMESPTFECTKAIEWLSSGWHSQVSNFSSAKVSSVNLSAQSRQYLEAGSSYWGCRLAIEGMK